MMPEKKQERKNKAKSTASEGASVLLLYWAMEALSTGEYIFGGLLLIVGLSVMYVSWVYGIKVPKEYADEIKDAVFEAVDGVSRRMEEEGQEE